MHFLSHSPVSGAYLEMALGGWIISNSLRMASAMSTTQQRTAAYSVASRPAYSMIALTPPAKEIISILLVIRCVDRLTVVLQEAKTTSVDTHTSSTIVLTLTRPTLHR